MSDEGAEAKAAGAEAEANGETGAKAGAGADAEAGAKAEAGATAKAEAKGEAGAKAEAGATAKAEAEGVAEAKADGRAKAESEDRGAAQDEGDAESEAEAGDEGDAEAQGDAEAGKEAAKADSSATDRVIRLLGDGTETAWVRRKIVVFRRLEPSDERSPGSLPLEESPYMEAKLVELAVPRKAHDEMATLAKKRAEALSITTGLFRSYDPAGWLVAGGGGALFGLWLDYLPRALLWPLVGVTAVGVVVGFATRAARASAEREAERRWRESPDRKEYDAIAKELAESWARAQATLKRETGFHTVIRVAEGSVDPLRLASIDPRPYSADPPSFDPDDFLPSEDGGAVRYEHAHATGEVVTQALQGTHDFLEK